MRGYPGARPGATSPRTVRRPAVEPAVTNARSRCPAYHVDVCAQVQYKIYVPAADVDASSGEAAEAAASALQRCNDVAATICAGHIWHREPFALRLLPSQAPSTASPPPDITLHGQTHFGDNIDDEWLVVHLLLRITEEVPGAVASVLDSDGEFLLVEAADALPGWVNPATATNRVFLCRGGLHLLPPPTSPAELGVLPVGTPPAPLAVSLVRGQFPTAAAPTVNKAVLARVGAFPRQLETCVHWARCNLPAALGAALAVDQSLVAPAVAAFYERDPIDMKACSGMARFKVDTRQPVSVRFTRCLYAMLAQQRFESARVFGPAPRRGTPDHRAHDIGAKLALGFEILASRGGAQGVGVAPAAPPAPTTSAPAKSASTDDAGAEQGRGGSNVDSAATPTTDKPESQQETAPPAAGTPPDDVAAQCAGPRWERFLRQLRASHYFRGNIDGSQEFRSLLASAQRYFVASVLPGEAAAGVGGLGPGRTDDAATYLDRGARRLHAALATAGGGPWKLDASRDDDDGWLTLDEAAVDKLVRERWGANPHPDFMPKGEAMDAEAAAQLDAMIGKVKGFVRTISSFEGAEVDPGAVGGDGNDDSDSDDVDSADGSDTDTDDDTRGGAGAGARHGSGGARGFDTLGGDGELSFDFGAFESELRAMLGDGPPEPRDVSTGESSCSSDDDGDESGGQGNGGGPDSFAPRHAGGHSRPTQLGDGPTAAAATAPKATDGEGTPGKQGADATMEELTAQMDAELAGTKVMESFAEADAEASEAADPMAPLDLDMNLVRNTLRSFSAQQGLAGPVSSLLGSLDVYLPPDAPEDDASPAE